MNCDTDQEEINKELKQSANNILQQVVELNVKYLIREIRTNIITLSVEQKINYRNSIIKGIQEFEPTVKNLLEFLSYKEFQTPKSIFPKINELNTKTDFSDFGMYYLRKHTEDINTVKEMILEEFVEGELHINTETNKFLKNGIDKKLTNKSKILILKSVGLFDKLNVNLYPNKEIAKLISWLLDMSFDNAKDYLENIEDKNGSSNKKSPYNKQSIELAENTLKPFNID
jgi:hypothetical protein